jgi:hypothetical protein
MFEAMVGFSIYQLVDKEIGLSFFAVKPYLSDGRDRPDGEEPR